MIKDLTQLPGLAIGEITGVDPLGNPTVSWSGGAPVSAHAVWLPGAPSWTECVGVRVLLAFPGGDEGQPVVLGLLDAPPVREMDEAVPAAGDRIPEVLRIEAGRELVIECGEAKIWLRKDGRIEIRGTHLISRSSGPNKIKGGSVFIN